MVHTPWIACQRKARPATATREPAARTGDLARRPTVDETQCNAERVERTGRDHEADAVEQSIGARRQFRTVGVAVEDGKEADNDCRDPQPWPRLAEHREPQRNRR